MDGSNGITEQLQGLTAEERRALLARLLRDKKAQATLPAGNGHGAGPATGTAPALFPLSYGQKSLWYLHQLSPDSPAYNEAFTSRIRSPLEVAPLLKVLLQAQADRHPALRTTYVSQLGEPRQQVHARQAVSLPVIDASAWDPGELESHLKEEARKPFDLERGPMLRPALFRCGPQDYVLLITFHHIAIDLWSLWLLTGELQTLSAGQAAGGKALPAAAYVDFVSWQAAMLEGPRGQALWEYWSRQLAGELPVLDLPADRPRPPVRSWRGEHQNFRLSRELSERLKRLAQEEQATLFTLLLAAFQAFLGRYTGQTDVLVGSFVAGRSRPEFERMVGFCTNMVALRADLSANPPFRAFLARARQTALEALAHQDYPFALLVERLLPNREPSRPPLCSSSFVLQQARQLDTHDGGAASRAAPPAAAGPARLAGPAKSAYELVAPAERRARTSAGNLAGEVERLDLGIVQTDLDLEMFERGGVLGGCLSYSTDLFEPATIERMVRNFEVLLEGLVADPDRRLADLPLLTEAERRQLLVDWNGKAVAYPRDRFAPRLIEDQAARAPGTVAVAWEGGELTYQEFNARANQLAHHLRALGVGPDTRVGIFLERSPELAVAVLAVLKAGGAYVPLDPACPGQRLAFLLEDAAVAVLLTRRPLLDRLPSSHPSVVLLGADRDVIAGERRGVSPPVATANPEPVTAAEHLAYVIYTSGSTGTPKGIPIHHQALLSHCHAFGERFGLCPTDRVLQFAALSFDMAVEEMLPTWTAGGCVVLAPTDGLDLAGFLYYLERQRVTVVMPPAAYWHEWVAELPRLPNPLPSSLRLVASGSDTLSAERLAQWQRHLGSRVRWLSGYGPTEATVTATIYEPKPACATAVPAVSTPASTAGTAVAHGGASVPIGKPLANTRVYVLDAHLQPVPVGVAGELFIGGERLARGYLNRPELTAEKFVRDPFSADPGARLYRTGDRARWLADGNLEFLGRFDHQVKVRGFRIEVGEIEAVLAQHPVVQQAVALVRDDLAGQKRLVAYVVPSADGQPAQEPDAGHGLVAGWEQLFDASYGAGDFRDPEFDFSGWNSSYTGKALPQDEMLEWADQTMNRIRRQCHGRPGRAPRVLEIGCGTGLVLFRLAPECERYVGTDFSPSALEHARRHAARRGLGHAELLPRPADDFSGLEPGAFDCVIINSVVQYFPDAAYLVRVLGGALQLLRPGGTVFLGDVRNLRLLEAFQASIHLSQAPAELPAAQLLQRVRRRLAQEKELLVDPAFFRDLGRHLPEVTGVEVQPRRGRARNELSKFRYDVVLHRGGQTAPPEYIWLHWGAEGLTLPGLRQRLAEERPAALGLRSVANARVAADVEAWRLLGRQGLATVDELRQALQERPEGGVDPDELAALGEELGYEVHLGWGNCDDAGSFDVLFTVAGDGVWSGLTASGGCEPPVAPAWPAAYANSPLRGQDSAELVPGLRRFLQAKLPEYMVPSAFVVLDDLPLTPSGKLDRLALPAPEAAPVQGLVLPRTETEAKLAKIWAAVLGRDSIGVHDNFFELGGDSILSLQVIARAGEAGLPLTPRQLLQYQTVAELAAAAGTDAPVAAEQEEAPAPLPLRLDPDDRDRIRAGQPDVEDVYPLSPTQQGLLFHTLYAPEGGIYFEHVRCTLSGIDPELFRQAWQEALDHHPILRTGFVWEDVKEPLQVVRRGVELSWEEHDLRGLSMEEQTGRIEAVFTEDRRRGFDLGRPPLQRLALFQLSENTYRFLWTHHHLLLDGWSTSLLLKEVLLSYEARRRGVAPTLPPVRPYRDYIAWLQSQDLAEAERFWRQALAGFDTPTVLGIERSPDGSHDEAESADELLELSPELTAALGALARRFHVTVNTVVQGAFALLLGSYSGRDDVVFGATVAGRPAGLRGVESMLGLFVSALPVRVRLDPEAGLRDWLTRLHASHEEARLHESTPLLRIQSWSEVPAGVPLFNALYAFQNFPLDSAFRDVGKLGVTEVQMGNRTNYPLSVMAFPTAGRLVLRATFQRDRYEQADVARLLAAWQALLQGIVANPDRRLKHLPLLNETERRQVLVDWNSTAAAYPADVCLHQLFEAQVERTPEAVAVVCGTEQLTYRELNARSNRLARRLCERGVGPDVLVGLCAERSVEMVVGLFAVLKAGGAYVPLDAEYPPDRLAFMLQDAHAPVLLTQRHLQVALPEMACQVVLLDEADDVLPPLSPLGRGVGGEGKGPASGVTADHLAYVLYTSGSTGNPKGVMIGHRAIVNHMLWMGDAFPLGADDAVLQKTPISFDASVWEFYAPLLAGARLVMAPPGAHREPAALVRATQEYQVTTLQLVPTLLRYLVDEPGLANCVSLRRVFCGGEALPVELVKRLSSRLAVEVHNLYGPTEATIDATSWACRPTDPGQVAPIGRPIANMRAYVLDTRLQPVPVGVPGELYLGGAGLARGYLNRPELTAAKFVRDPFSAEPEARLYRTGDRARWLPDGSLMFLGRLDHQVKLRGFRIELGEVEAALTQHPAVRQAVALVRDDHAGQKRLVAYVVPAAGQPGVVPSDLEPELRGFLQAKLPEYMVPSAFVVLDALPLTPSGKLDRRALPTPTPGPVQNLVLPRNEVEAKLAEIWAAVLGRDQVGIHDNFFALGGDSILSLQVIARANQAGLRLTPRQLFQHQTVAELAPVAGTNLVVQAEQGEVTGPVPLTPIQHWFFEQAPADAHHWNQSVLLEATQPLDAAVIQRAVHEVLSHHDALRFRYRLTDRDWQQEGTPGDADLSAHAGVPVSRIDLSHLSGAEQTAAVEREASRLQGSLNLQGGPLLQVALFDRGPGRSALLLFAVHHLVIDAVSWGILLQDFLVACEQLARGHQVSLPPKTTSFKQWSERLLEYAGSERVQQEQTHWLRERKEGTVALPVDFAGGSNLEGDADSAEVTLTADETTALLQDVPGVYHTRINDVLLTALVQAFAPWTGSSSLLLDLEGHGREQIADDLDLSRTVGWFTTLFPVLLDLEDVGDPGLALRTVKEQLRAIPGQGLSYGLLRYLGAEDVAARLRAQPQAQVSFNYLGQADRAVPPGLPVRLAQEPGGLMRSPRAARPHLLEVTAIVSAGRLQINWRYGTQVHRRETIATVAERFVAALRRLLAHCRTPGAGGYSPSDFPLARLPQADLDRLFTGVRHVEDVYPLSGMQQGMLFHTLYAPEAGLYHEHVRCTLSGLNTAAFRRAWQQVVEQYPVLRTSFLWEGVEQPLQVVWERVELPWEEHDLRGLSETEQTERIEAAFEAERRSGFDLSRAPLLRLALFRLADNTYRFLWSHHHLLLDGWSVPLLLKQVVLAYEAALRGVELPPEPVRPYRDYIAWLQQQDPAEAERFWRQTLSGFDTPTVLGIERPAAVPDHEESWADEILILSPELTASLESLARQLHVTLNTVVQGAFGLLLGVYSGREDVVFGATVAGRPAELQGVDRMLGLFVNSLPVRQRLTPDVTLRSWLTQLHASHEEARQYEATPLLQVQAWSAVPAGVPLFNTLFVFQNYPIDQALRQTASGLQLTDTDLGSRTNYPLLLLVAPLGDRLRFQATSQVERYAPADVARFLSCLQALLEGMAANPESRLADLPLLSRTERRQLLLAWNDTHADYPREQCLHHLFEAQAQRTPEASALVWRQQQWSYRELNERAASLAHSLRKRGVGPDVLVGLCLVRSPDLLVGLLGILKAGGVCVPLDPAYPRERLAFMLQDARVSLLLTQQSLAARLPDTGARLLCLDTDTREATLCPGEESSLDSGVTPAHLAYVLYTSGSTGQPKGVAMPHRALVNLISWQLGASAQGAGGRTLQFAPVSFDVSFQEIFATWGSGGTLVAIDEETQRDLAALPRLLVEQSISRVFLPFVALQQLAEACCQQGVFPASLKEVITAGEQLVTTPALLQLFRELPNCELHNHYGPTETHVVTAFRLQGDPSAWPPLPPIGRPIANARVHVLDRGLRPVPVGVPGELYLGGACLARGYLGRPELTAERFVPDPFAGGLEKLYRTGDLARWLPTGDLEFLGRGDAQVKLRGYRIELGEVEAVLGQHPAVAQVAVVVREDRPGDKRLTAYVVAKEASGLQVADLRGFLQAKLPDYMVPSAFVVLDTLPLTPSGKVHRQALPAPDTAAAGLADAPVAPRDELERQLTAIWEEILGRSPIGIRDNFFELGGHSLLAMRLFGRMEEVLGQRLPLAALFQTPTVEGLANQLRGQRSAIGSALVPLQTAGEKRPFFCAPPIAGVGFCYADLARRLGPDRPFYALQAQGVADEAAPLASVEALAAHFVAAVRTVQPEGPYLLGGWSMGGSVAYEMARQLQAQGQAVDLLALFDAGCPTAGLWHSVQKDPTRWAAVLAQDTGMEELVGRLLRPGAAALAAEDFEQLQAFGLALPGVTLEQAHRLSGVFQAYFAAFLDYTPPPQTCPVSFFRAGGGQGEALADPDLGWSRLAPVAVRHVPGEHHTMMQEPHVGILAQQLQACFAAVEQSARPSG